MTGSGIENAGEFFPTLKGTEPSENEWEKLTKDENGYYNAEGWLRCHYAKVCGSFEGNISNAGGNINKESKVFGNYRMVEAYINAYTKENKSDRNEALLDYVEKWYKENHAILSDYNRVRDDDGDKESWCSTVSREMERLHSARRLSMLTALRGGLQLRRMSFE